MRTLTRTELTPSFSYLIWQYLYLNVNVSQYYTLHLHKNNWYLWKFIIWQLTVITFVCHKSWQGQSYPLQVNFTLNHIWKVNTVPVAAISTSELFYAWRPRREDSSLLAESETLMLWGRECCGHWANVCNISWENVWKSSENHQNIFGHFRQHLEVFRKQLGIFGNSNHDKMTPK